MDRKTIICTAYNMGFGTSGAEGSTMSICITIWHLFRRRNAIWLFVVIFIISFSISSGSGQKGILFSPLLPNPVRYMLCCGTLHELTNSLNLSKFLRTSKQAFLKGFLPLYLQPNSFKTCGCKCCFI